MKHRITGGKNRGWKNLPFWAAAVLSTLTLMTSGAANLGAGCMDLADEPLEINSMGAPGMVMFVYDNSGSMFWSIMTDEDEGQFHYNGYVYSFLYDGESPNSTWKELQDSASHRMLWKTQWHGFNRVYYNPTLTYEPWPSWTEVADIAHDIPAAAPNADVNTPLMYVVRDLHGRTFDLNAVWATLEVGGAGDLDDLIAAHGIIVDNSDTTTVREIVVDDEGDGVDVPGFTFTGSHGDWNWPPENWNYYDGDYMNYYGNTHPLPVSATWSFDVETAGNYEVWVSVPYHSSRISKAKYTITHAGGSTTKTISQYYRYGEKQEWVSLGSYNFNAGTGAGRVVLNFTATESGGRVSIGVDAIRLVPTFTTGTSDRYFTFTGPWGIATSSYDYGANYLWTPQINEMYTAAWTAENLDPGTEYNAYVRWVGNAWRSNAVKYLVDGDTVYMDQRYNSGKWMLLKDNISFFKDIGLVQLEHYCDSTNWDRACADAVAFLPSSFATGTSVNIIMAHYFIQNNNGTYLVNLDGSIKYYKVTDDGDDLVENGELSEMTLADAQAAGIVSGRTYEQERQNFANWFQFSRSRDHVGRYAVAKLVQAMGNIYFGLSTCPPRDVYAIRAIKETQVLNRDDTLSVLNNIYNLPDPKGSTPLKDAFMQVPEYFEGAASLVNAHDKAYFIDGGYATDETYPYLNMDHGGHCQQAFMIAMTDGFYNMNQGQNVGNLDGDCNTVWDCGKYADDYTNTLADISMDFYERDLKSDDILIDEVPTNQWDQNKEQHLVTYALSFGVEGQIDPDLYPDCNLDGACPDWPLPVEGEMTTIDDLYHSTINGRGLYLNASNPQELVDALMKIKQNIEERLGSSAAVTTSSVQRQIGTYLYRDEYMTGKWTGDLKALKINVKTGAVEEGYAWSASQKLKTKVDENGYESRKIYSFNGTDGIAFNYNAMTEDQKTRLEQGLTYAFGTAYDFGSADVSSLVEYLKGDTSHDLAHGGPFRARTDLLGDIVHSEAEYHDGVVYVGSNDGMLHAFHALTGEEQGAYVPNVLYGELGKLAYPDYQHQYFVNNTAFVANTGTQKLLVCPMGKGYKGLFVIDVSAPLGQAEPSKVGLWEYPAPGVIDPDLGYTYSYAGIFNTGAAGWVVITGNGYDSDNGHAVLYVFNALTGAVVKKFDTGVGGCNGLSSPAIIDPDSNGLIDFVYAGDLKGNMWKFDLRGSTVSDWDFAYKEGNTPMPLVTISDPDGNPQPITNMPAVMFAAQCEPPGNKGYLVLFGTGRYLGLTDLADGSQQSVYGVYDWGPDWEIKTGEGTDVDKYLGNLTVGEPRTLSHTAHGVGKDLELVKQTVSATRATVDGATYRFITNNPVLYYNLAAAEGNAMGWYMDLPDYKERMVRRPLIRNNIFIFVANIPERSVCSAGGSSCLYQVDACTGGWPGDPQFDTSGDGDFNEEDLIGGVPPIGLDFNSIIMDPTLLEDVLYLNDLEDVKGNPIPELPLGAWFWHVVE